MCGGGGGGLNQITYLPKCPFADYFQKVKVLHTEALIVTIGTGSSARCGRGDAGAAPHATEEPVLAGSLRVTSFLGRCRGWVRGRFCSKYSDETHKERNESTQLLFRQCLTKTQRFHTCCSGIITILTGHRNGKVFADMGSCLRHT